MPLRLYTPHTLAVNQSLELSPEQSHYLVNVMRRKEGEELLLFNGKDGEWLATITEAHKKHTHLQLIKQIKPQRQEPDIWLVFAPVKNVRLNFIAEKATELGVAALQPMLTKHTVVHRVSEDKLEANVIEAAEQCERLTIPHIYPLTPLETLLNTWDSNRRIILCDESGGGKPAIETLQAIPPEPAALFIGPEGGFSRSELDKLHKLPYVTAIGLGPRILRADTAVMAALTCWQAIHGDWHEAPRFISREE